MNINNMSILTGRIASDIKQDILPESKKPIAYFRLAINKKQNKELKVQFIPIKAFDKKAIFISKYFNKGDLVNLMCNINVEDIKQEDGTYKQYWSLIVDEIEKLAKPKNTQQQKLAFEGDQPRTTIIQY